MYKTVLKGNSHAWTEAEDSKISSQAEVQNKLRVGLGYTANPHPRTKQRKGEKRKERKKERKKQRTSLKSAEITNRHWPGFPIGETKEGRCRN